MNVLVTGAGGFLGRCIAEQLRHRGDHVWGFSRRSYPILERLGVQSVCGDVRDVAAVHRACQGMDAVIHTAGVAGIWGPWQLYYDINTRGTRNVVAGCLQANVSRLVYSSSPSVTFEGRDQCGVDETVGYARRWLCHYPHSKALAEQEVLQANGQSGLFCCALRPHLIWGPGDAHLIPRLLQRARAGKLRRVGDGSNLVDHVYVDNAATAHVQAADALDPGGPAGGQAYFISQGKPVNCWQWINDILRLAQLPAVTRSISRRTAWRWGALFELLYRAGRIRREPPMTRFLAAQLGTSHYFDLSRARADLGYEPRVATEVGMQRLGEQLAAAAAASP